jgi:hypothetical protein
MFRLWESGRLGKNNGILPRLFLLGRRGQGTDAHANQPTQQPKQPTKVSSGDGGKGRQIFQRRHEWNGEAGKAWESRFYVQKMEMDKKRYTNREFTLLF